MNFGAFGLFAASLKCEVWGFEMQPHIYTAVDMSIRLSGYRAWTHIHNNAVFHVSGRRLSFDSFKMNFGQTELRRDDHHKQQVLTTRIDDILSPHLQEDDEIFFMKMDIENCEAYALLGMQSLILAGRVRHIGIESQSPLLLKLFFLLGYQCIIYDDFNGASGCVWPHNLNNSRCELSTYEHAESFFRTYSAQKGYYDTQCHRPRYTPPAIKTNRVKSIKSWKYVNKFVQIANESFTNRGDKGEFVHSFDDEIYYLSEENSFLLEAEDKQIVNKLHSEGKLSLLQIPFTEFFLNFVFNTTFNEDISALLRTVIHSNNADKYSEVIQDVTIFNNKITSPVEDEVFEPRILKVDLTVRNEWQKTLRRFSFNTSKVSVEEFARQKCVAMDFVNHWGCELDRDAVLVTFNSEGNLKFVSGYQLFDADNQNKWITELNRCVEYFVDRIMHYQCEREPNKSESSLCKGVGNILQPKIPDVMKMEVFVGNIGSPVAKLEFKPDTYSPQSVSNDFCRTYLAIYIHKFISSNAVTIDGVAPENKLYTVTEVDMNGCLEVFSKHVARMMSEVIHLESNEELSLLQLKIYE